jgi:uncharacterized membrane protein
VGRVGLAAAALASGVTAADAASLPTDADALALSAKHCAACHSAAPTHPAFDKPPKGIRLDTIEGLRSWAKSVAIRSRSSGRCRSATRPT